MQDFDFSFNPKRMRGLWGKVLRGGKRVYFFEYPRNAKN